MSSPRTLYRIGYGPDPWELSPVPAFKGRFDDPDRIYRVLYASGRLVGSYLECLARFRPSFLPGLAELTGEFAPDYLPSGLVPRDWIEKNVVGRAKVEGRFADIYSAEWISRLREPLRPLLAPLGLPDLDVSVLKQAKHRHITQLASKIIREEGYDGIFYRSRWGDDLQNWAIFQPFKISEKTTSPINPVDPELTQALRLLSASLEETPLGPTRS